MIKLEPLISEKSTQATAQNRYTLRVNRRIKKSQIKKAIEEKFKVNVIGLETMVVKKKKNWKKVIVKLKKGQKIKGFGGQDET